METNEVWNELRRLSGLLTQPSALPGKLFRASEQLYALFLRNAGLEEDSPPALSDILLPQGKALAPVWAARCILDYQRTRVFLRGILQAIRAAQVQFPHTQIHVLYAGCGPFATLILPLIPQLEKGSVVFTLLEVSPASIGYLERTITAFQVSAWIREIVVADATNYQMDPNLPVHLLIGEMMQAGLQTEPQVAAMYNLAPQLAAGALVVPQSITVQAGLLHPRRNQERMLSLDTQTAPVFTLLGSAFELSLPAIAARPALDFPEMELDMPADRDPGFRQLALFTRIQVFANEVLETWESALTQPQVMTSLAPDKVVKKIGLRYRTGVHPGFNWRIID